MDTEKNYKYKTANYMRELANQRNIELIDIKKETDKILKKLLDMIETMAAKGNYSVTHMYNKSECNIIENVIEELEKLGFRTKQRFM
jgi:Skp family chaperone for outer membrane proteins